MFVTNFVIHLIPQNLLANLSLAVKCVRLLLLLELQEGDFCYLCNPRRGRGGAGPLDNAPKIRGGNF